MDANTLRVLEFDGGGERGYLSLNWFNEFIQLWGISQSDIFKNFDVICGNSIGGLIALGLSFGLTIDQMFPFFTVDAPYIFSLTSLTPSVRPGKAAKIALVIANTPFYQSSGPTAADYGSGRLAAKLQETFGNNTLQNLKTNVIIPTYNYATSTYTLCSNLNYPDFYARNELISNVALATSAAPLYLPPLEVNNLDAGRLNGIFLDGAVYQNNPGQFGFNLGKMIKPNANRYCVLSVGTGLGEKGFDPDQPDIPATNSLEYFTSHPQYNQLQTIFTSQVNDTPSSIDLLVSLLGTAITGGQESVAKNLFLQSSYTLDNLYYYRFQPNLDLTINTELDNTDPEILSYYSNLATSSFNNDIDNISTFLGHLTA
jgi:patatin-like phospholipase/acyl hydrolase